MAIDIGCDIGGDAEGANNDVPVRRLALAASIKPCLIKAVVAGQLMQFTRTQAVKPAITGVKDQGAVGAGQPPHANHGGTHAPTIGIAALLIVAKQAVIGLLNSGTDQCNAVTSSHTPAFDSIADDFNGGFTGDVPASVPAHAIADDAKASFGIDDEIIFVTRARAPNIR